MIFSSIKAKLNFILALLGVILFLMFVNYWAGKAAGKWERTYSSVVELEKKLAHVVSLEANSLADEGRFGVLKKKYHPFEQLCLECHAKQTDLIQERLDILDKMYEGERAAVQDRQDVRHYLNELTTSVRYIHEHHIASLKNFLNRNILQEQTALNGKLFKKSDIHSAPELDIIRQTVVIKQSLTDLLQNFYALNVESSPWKIQKSFTENISAFYRSINTFEDFSLDAQDGLLVEELLDGGRNFERLFSELIRLEKSRNLLAEELEENFADLVSLLSAVEHKIRIKRDNLRDRSLLLEQTSFVFGLLLLTLIFLRSRAITRAVAAIVDETGKIQTDFSYRIKADPNAMREIQVVSRTLNVMADTIGARIGKLRDEIDVRIKAENNLATEKERLSVTLASIGDAVITSDTEGNLVFLNKVAEKLTGWVQHEAVGRPVAEVFNIINEKTGMRCDNPVQKVLELNRIIGLANHTALIAKDGRQRSIADSGAPIRDRESRIIGVVLVFRDVTEQLKMEEELLKVKKLESVGVLAGGIAHDFNNLLTAILGNINLAGEFVDAENKAYPLLQEAEKASWRARNLTKQLLTFAKGGEPILETTSLENLIRESGNFVLHGSPVACAYHFPTELWLVDVDTGQVSQVIQNLIINARHSMPEGGSIDVTCKNIADITAETFLSLPRGDYVKITIRDHGNGIPEDILDQVFDPFFTTKKEGSGLGLAICYSIINKHNGHISVESKAGRGTTFTIYLPAISGQKTEMVETAQAGLIHGSGTVMVMDDEELIRNIAAHMLNHLGYDVLPVKDGNEAVRQFKELRETDKPVDVIIMDLTIPGGMGGQEAVQEILNIDPEAKVIVSSGYSNDPAMANCREYGFCAAVSKPFDLTVMSETIRSVLQGTDNDHGPGQ